ncbi:EEF1A lysine methyltransferase 4 isoform X2 [Brachyhypopomus gauderio]|uniref:EEF1A lysine methyltransferase 4 isoform X2 n=1 Tax=Brachyhypopomus gauderio TaxID=698409 RepID=UPI004041C990
MEVLPDRNARYRDAQYWDERYTREESFEWFGDFSKFQHLLVQHVGTEESILMLGCGNSSLTWDMYQTGFSFITSVDFSSVCVETMAQRHPHHPGLSWLCMDVRRLAFPDGVFDVVVEKGTLDAMLVEETDPWNISYSGRKEVHQVLSETFHMVKASLSTLGLNYVFLSTSVTQWTSSRFSVCLFTVPTMLVDRECLS